MIPSKLIDALDVLLDLVSERAYSWERADMDGLRRLARSLRGARKRRGSTVRDVNRAYDAAIVAGSMHAISMPVWLAAHAIHSVSLAWDDASAAAAMAEVTHATKQVIDD